MTEHKQENPEGGSVPVMLPGVNPDAGNGYLGDLRSRLDHNEDSQTVLADLRKWILDNPLSESAFALLGDVYANEGRIHESVVALERAMQLKAVSSARRSTAAIARLKNLTEAAASPERGLHLSGYAFFNLQHRNSRTGDVLHGRSLCGKAYLRLLLKPLETGVADWEKERSILSDLTEAGSQTAPSLLGHGELDATQVAELQRIYPQSIGQGSIEHPPYIIEAFLPSLRGYRFADLALSLIEQQCLGVYHGHICPSKIHYNPESGICCLRSFDEAIRMDARKRKLLPRNYVNWLNELHQSGKARSGRHFLHEFRSLDLDRDFWSYFRNGSLDLSWTELFQKQLTTASAKRIHQSHPGKRVHIKGERGIAARAKVFNQIPFEEEEAVADVGCASGLICEWLASRGCQVTGIDMDKKLIRGNRILANIKGYSITYHGLDVEHEELPGDYDTLCLFSTIQHFLWPKETVQRLIRHCRSRVLIEAPLKGRGAKWVGNKLESGEAFSYEDPEVLINNLLKLFPGFSLGAGYGKVDRGHHVFELKRNGLL